MQTPIRQKRPNFRFPYFRPSKCRPYIVPPFAPLPAATGLYIFRQNSSVRGTLFLDPMFPILPTLFLFVTQLQNGGRSGIFHEGLQVRSQGLIFGRGQDIESVKVREWMWGGVSLYPQNFFLFFLWKLLHFGAFSSAIEWSLSLKPTLCIQVQISRVLAMEIFQFWRGVWPLWL